MDLEDLNIELDEFIDNYTILEKKINKIISLKYCTCEIYAPYTKNGSCRFCHGY